MALKEFNNLSTYDKYVVTFQQGDFIEYFVNGEKRFALYSVFKFYTEVEYNSIENKVNDIVCFEGGTSLFKKTLLKN